MLSIFENFMLLVWAIIIFSLPIIVIMPIIFANDPYD